MARSDVPLRDGPTVPLVVVEWLLGLADRGLSVAMGADGRAKVNDPAKLTGEDRDIIAKHRLAIREAVAYVEAVTGCPLDRIGTPWPVQAVRSLPAPAAVEAPEPHAPSPEPTEVRLW